MDELQSQLEERRRNMSRRHDQTLSLHSTAETEQKVSESVESLLRSVEQRKSRLRDLQSNITQLQQEYEAEAILLAKEQEVLRRFRATQEQNQQIDNDNDIDTTDRTQMNVDANDERNIPEVAGSPIRHTEADQQYLDEERKKQEQHDEELALHLQRQFDIENNEEESNQQRQQQRQPFQQPQLQRLLQERQQQQQQRQQPRNRGTTYSYTFGTNPNNMITITNSRDNEDETQNENADPAELLRRFSSSDNEDNNFFSPFGRPMQFVRRSSSTGRSNRNFDPLEQIFGMPLLRMGGMGMPFVDIDSLDQDQLLQLFPTVPRGASEEIIQSLPENRYVAQPNQNQNQNQDSNDKEEKNDLEACCICMEEFKTGDSIRRLPCMHIFHKQEIDTWLRRNHICPICRIPVDEQPQQRAQ